MVAAAQSNQVHTILKSTWPSNAKISGIINHYRITNGPSLEQVVLTKVIPSRVSAQNVPAESDNPHATFPHQVLRVYSAIQLVIGIIFCILGLIDVGMVAALYPGCETTQHSKIGCSLYQLWLGIPVSISYALTFHNFRMKLSNFNFCTY